MRQIAVLVLLLLLATTAAAIDFKIQKGRSTINTSSTTTTITAGVDYTAPADINKAFIRLVDSRSNGNGKYATGGSQAPAVYQVTINNPTNLLTSIQFGRYNGSATFPTTFDWEIIEYIGPAGGPNEFIVRDVNLASAVSNVRATGRVAYVNNPNKAVPFLTGQRHNSTTASTLDRGLFTGVLNGFTPSFTRGDGTGTSVVSYALVEFTGKNWEISRVENSAYAAANTWEVDELSQILNDVNRAFIHTQIRTTSGTNDEAGHLAYLADVNNMRSKVPTGASVPTQTITTVAWVIENTQVDGNRMNVWRYAGTQSTTSTKEWTTSITALRDANRSSIFGSSDSAGTGTQPPRGNISWTFDNSTTVRLWRSDGNNTNNYVYEVVEWPDAPSVGAGTAKTAFTFKVTAGTTGHSVTYGGTCSADAFFFVETNAQYDPDPDMNAARVVPSSNRTADANCQSSTIAGMTITNTGTNPTNIDANFASAFTGSDVNILLKVWMGTGTGCGTFGLGGWEEPCSITSTTTAVNQTQCKKFDHTNATTGTRLITSLPAGDTNQLCYSGDFNGWALGGDHNQTFQTGSNFS